MIVVELFVEEGRILALCIAYFAVGFRGFAVMARNKHVFEKARKEKAKKETSSGMRSDPRSIKRQRNERTRKRKRKGSRDKFIENEIIDEINLHKIATVYIDSGPSIRRLKRISVMSSFMEGDRSRVKYRR